MQADNTAIVTTGYATGRAAAPSRSDERRRIAVICIALFLVTLGVYRVVGAPQSGDAHAVNQANNIIHGHLDILPQYTRNMNNLERSLYDGHGFCYPPGDSEIPTVANPRISQDCKTYMQFSLGPAIMALPGVLIWGNNLNETLVSEVFGAMTAPIVFLIAGAFAAKRSTQLLLTVLMMFGTIFFFVAANGGVWYYAHTIATFFILAAIYFAVARPIPLLAGVMLGAAFLCRPTMIATGMFFVVAFIPLWFRRPSENNGSWGINLAPALSFAAGLAPFLAAEGLLNYLRFDNPLETGYGYTEQAYQTKHQSLFSHGLFSLSYITRHPPVIFEAMPIFSKPGADCIGATNCAPIVTPDNGMAIWVTTPAFLMAVFTGVTDRRVVKVGAALLAIACVFLLSRAVSNIWNSGWRNTDIPFGLELLPFWLMIGAALFFALRNRSRLVIACWAAIIPTAFVIFNFAAVGATQFGYRYALDFTPFLWLLVCMHIGNNLKWWHVALILAGVAVNLMGVLWIFHFELFRVNGWTWVSPGDPVASPR
jgi:hypothetical protein